MLKHYSVSNIFFQSNFMFFCADGENYKVNLEKVSKALLKASSKERQTFRILDGGYGITWFPVLNEDLSLHELIKQAEKI